MANRTVSVSLIANVGSYVGSINKAAAATMRLGESAQTSTKKAQSGFDLAGKGALIMGAAVVGGMATAIGKSMDFEKSMSAVGAATQATAATLGDLREAAMKAGADTQYSATEAADAITEMAKAGVSAKDIMGGGLSGALSLAAAGQIEVADAAGIASVAMTQFSLSGADLPHVADLLAAGAGKAMGSVQDLGAALNQSGLIASAAGLSIEETTGTLAAFANAGLIGSDSGTSFKTMLQALQAPTEKSAGLMAELGINMYDANGNMLGVSEMAGQLQGALGGLTEEQRNSALATIFGSDAVRAANVLYKEGAGGIQEWIDKTNDAGYAQETAAALTDNLRGDLEKLGGAFETLMINLGSGAQGPLREVVQAFTGLLDVAGGVLDFWQGLSGPVQLAVVAAVGWAVAGDRIMGILKPMGAALGPLRGTWSAFGEALGYARANGDGLTTVLKSVGETAGGAALNGVKALGRAIGPELAIGAAVLFVGQLVESFKALGSASSDAQAAAESLAGSLTLTNDALDRQSVRNAIEDTEGLVDILGRAGVASQDAINGLLGEADAQDRVTAALQRYMGTLDPRRGEVTAEDVRQAVMAYEELAGGYDNAAGSARYFAGSSDGAAAAATGAAEGIPVLGNAIATVQTQTEESAKALEDWLTQAQETLTGFAEPLATYKTLLGEKETAERESAEKTAAATTSSSDSWKDYVTDVDVSLDELADRFQEQLDAQENWRTNLGIVAQRAGADVAQALFDMGEEGIDLTAKMANGTDAEVKRMAGLITRDAQMGGRDAGVALKNELAVMAAVGKAGANATRSGIANELNIGVGEVQRIFDQYGVKMATGINPILSAIGKRVITINQKAGRTYAGLNAYDVGGYTGDGGKYQPAGIVHAGEYVLTKEQTSRLGIDRIEEFANNGYASGGFVSPSDVPRPPSTAPFRAPISTAADGALAKVYGDTVEWVKANLAPQLGPGIGYQAMMAALRTRFPGLPLISGFRPGAITATGNASYHGKGRAVDIPPSLEVNRWIYDNYKSQTKELILSLAGAKQVHNGQDHYYTGVTRADHFDHNHWAMANGGVIGEPVIGRGLWSGGSYSFGERGPETVTPGVRSREFSGGGGRSRSGGPTNVTVQARVFIGDREITDIARVEAEAVVVGAMTGQHDRTAY